MKRRAWFGWFVAVGVLAVADGALAGGILCVGYGGTTCPSKVAIAIQRIELFAGPNAWAVEIGSGHAKSCLVKGKGPEILALWKGLRSVHNSKARYRVLCAKERIDLLAAAPPGAGFDFRFFVEKGPL